MGGPLYVFEIEKLNVHQCHMSLAAFMALEAMRVTAAVAVAQTGPCFVQATEELDKNQYLMASFFVLVYKAMRMTAAVVAVAQKGLQCVQTKEK